MVEYREIMNAKRNLASSRGKIRRSSKINRIYSKNPSKVILEGIMNLRRGSQDGCL